MESVGVSLVQELAVLRVDRILIRIVLLHAGNKALPYACFIPLHDIRIPTPAVELAHDGDLDGVRRQYRKVVTFLSIAGLRMGAHKLVGAAVPAGLKQGGMIFFGCHPCLQSHAFISSKMRKSARFPQYCRTFLSNFVVFIQFLQGKNLFY